MNIYYSDDGNFYFILENMFDEAATMFSRKICLILCVSFLNGYESTLMNSIMYNAVQNANLVEMTEETGQTLVDIQEDIQSVLQLQSLVYSEVGEMKRGFKENQQELLNEIQLNRLIIGSNSSRMNTNSTTTTAAPTASSLNSSMDINATTSSSTIVAKTYVSQLNRFIAKDHRDCRSGVMTYSEAISFLRNEHHGIRGIDGFKSFRGREKMLIRALAAVSNYWQTVSRPSTELWNTCNCFFYLSV